MKAGGTGRSLAIPFEPGLEGLRGLSVIAVLLFHAEFSWASGGYLGVSTFFTLSGYLITTLLLVEHDATGRIDLRAFWARRFRRLMPAALIALAAIALLGSTFGTAQQLAGLRGDVLWALGYLANWHFLNAEVVYAQIFSDPSPVQHFWSLAIEEQFYLGFPLLAAAALAISRRALWVVALVLTVASLVAAWLLSEANAPIDRIYYGTDTRAAEFLVGALLALAGTRGREGSRRGSERWVLWGGPAALAVLLATWSSVPVTAGVLYRGGFTMHALVSAAIISAAVHPNGPVRTLLGVRPLRWVGRVSYGAYLYHWPIFLWLNPDLFGFSDFAQRAGPEFSDAMLLAMKLALTFVVAGASYRFIEDPIRTGRMLPGWQSWVAAPFAALTVVAITATLVIPEDALDFSPPEVAILDSNITPGHVPRIAIYGDSTALRLGVGLRRWIRSTDRALPTHGVVDTGCGVDSGGWRRHRGHERMLSRACTERNERWQAGIEEFPPDVVVVLTGRWEIADRKLAGDTQWRSVGDPVFDDYLRQELLRATDVLASSGALVVWLTSPSFEHSQRKRTERDPALDPQRVDRFNGLIRELERRRPGVAKVVEFGDFVATLPATIAGTAPRPDGVHLTDAAAFDLSERWLGPKILELLDVHRSD